MIAMALANEPDLLIADEPTTALDVTIQAQVLALLRDLQARLGMALLLITHDLGIVRRMASAVHVMQGGQIVESGPLASVFDTPSHPYTRRLLDAEPKGDPVPAEPDAPTVMQADALKVWFPVRRGVLRRTVGHIRRSTASTSRCARDTRWASSARAARARRTLGLEHWCGLQCQDQRREVRFRGRARSPARYRNRDYRAAAPLAYR